MVTRRQYALQISNSIYKVKATALSLLSCIFVILNGQRLRFNKFCLLPVSEPYNPPSWWTNERVKRLYPQSSIPNINPFRLKQMNFRIKVCQGCRGPRQSSLRTVTDTPFDFCEARKEWRTYKDPQIGELCTPARESDAHYHLRVACIQAAEPSFVPYLLVIPDGLPLTECHKNYITKEFGVKACSI